MVFTRKQDSNEYEARPSSSVRSAVDAVTATTSAAADDQAFEEKNRIAVSGLNPPPIHPGLGVDLATMPEDVKKNLVGLEALELDQALLKMMLERGKLFTVDMMVIEFHKLYNRVYPRAKIRARLRSLIHQRLVAKQANTRGIFTMTDAGRQLMEGVKASNDTQASPSTGLTLG